MNRLFESKGIADAYVKYRPHTPPFVKEKALQFLRKRSAPPKDGDKFELMLDVGCGSGQSTKAFSSDFNKVVGIDPSANQIEQAKKNNSLANIEYMVGSGEKLPVEDATVDLIVVGQAVHWFDLDKFFRECKRVLIPSGCFFAYGYSKKPRVSCVSREGDADWAKLKAESDAIVVDFNDNKCRFDQRIQFIFDDYEKVFGLIPSSDKERSIEREMEKLMSLESLSGYFRSWSGYHNHMTDTVKELVSESGMSDDEARRVYDEKHDILKETIGALRKCWSVDPSASDSDVTMRVTWTVPMVMSARPQC